MRIDVLFPSGQVNTAVNELDFVQKLTFCTATSIGNQLEDVFFFPGKRILKM